MEKVFERSKQIFRKREQKMSKEEFLKTLRKRLSILEDSEIEDIISEYEGYIEEKVNVGLSESEAIKELGDIDEIVSDLLAAYKVKEPKSDNFNSIINKFCNAIDNFMSSLDNKSAKDIIRILIEVIIILLAIWLLKIPFALIRNLGESIFYELHGPIGNILGSIWWIIIEFSYIIVAIIFFFKTFEKRYFKNMSIKIVEEVEDDYKKEKNKKSNKEEKETKSKKKDIVDETKETKSYETKKVNKVVIKERTFVDTLTDVCILILKFFAIIFIIGVIGYQIGISIALGFAIYLICRGVTYIGILILLIAFFVGGAFILELLINFIFNKKIKAYRVFASLISCIILLGIGLTMSAIEISNTEIIYDSSYKEMKTITKEIPIKSSNMPIYYYDNIIIDNNLKDTIKIEYSYPDINDIDLEIELENCGTGYCLYSDVKRFKWNKQILNYLVENLKDKKIYTYDFRVIKNIYVNEQDINKIKGNKYYYHHDEERRHHTVTKTLSVLNINEGNKHNYLYLTVKDIEDNEIETVEIRRDLVPNIEINKTYNFAFTYYGYDLDDDVYELFKKCHLLNITDVNSTFNE